MLAPAGGNLGRAGQIKSKAWSQKWKYAGQNLAIERVRGSDSAAVVFANVIPTLLVVSWAAGVLVWLLIRACCSSLSRVRSLRSELSALQWLSIAGGVIVFWFIVGYFARLSVLARHRGIVYVPRLVALEFAWALPLLLAVLCAWIWLRTWAKRHANGQYHASVRVLEQGKGFNTYQIESWKNDEESFRSRMSGDPDGETQAEAECETEVTPFQLAPTQPYAHTTAITVPELKEADTPPAYRSPTPGAGYSAALQPSPKELRQPIAGPSARPTSSKRQATKAEYMRVCNP